MLHAQSLETLSKVIDRLPRRATDAGPTLLRSHNSVADHKFFANLLIKVAPDSQPLCISALGNEARLITLNLEVTKDLSLRALVDCGASSNFVRRQSLEDRRLKFVESVTLPTRLTVRLARRIDSRDKT